MRVSILYLVYDTVEQGVLWGQSRTRVKSFFFVIQFCVAGHSEFVRRYNSSMERTLWPLYVLCHIF